MKKLMIGSTELAEYCTKYDDGTIKVTVPLAYQTADDKSTVVGTEVTITSNASKNAKGAISSLIKVSAPYMAFDKDLVTGEWTTNKRRSGAAVAAHLVLTIPQALVNDDAAGFAGAKQQLALMLLMLNKHLGALRADIAKPLDDADPTGFDLKTASVVKDLEAPSDPEMPERGRFVQLPTWEVIPDSRTRLGHALRLAADGKNWLEGTGRVKTITPTDEDTSLARALTGKRLIDCETPSYGDITLVGRTSV